MSDLRCLLVGQKKSHLGSNTQDIKLRMGGGTQDNGAEIISQPMGDQTGGDLHAAVCEGTHAGAGRGSLKEI